MNNRRNILKDLLKFYEDKGPNNYCLADTLKSFRTGDRKFLLSLNQLLREGLILGVNDPQGRLAICLNPEKLEVIKNKLLWYKDARFLVGIIVPILFGILVVIWEHFIKE